MVFDDECYCNDGSCGELIYINKSYSHPGCRGWKNLLSAMTSLSTDLFEDVGLRCLETGECEDV